MSIEFSVVCSFPLGNFQRFTSK